MTLLKMDKLLIVFILLTALPLAYAQCPGCIFNNQCIDVGEQRISSAGTLFCSSNHKMETVKSDSDSCQENYECMSFYCKDNQCFTPQQVSGESRDYSFVIYLFIFFIVIFAAYYYRQSLSLLFKVKSKSKETKTQESKTRTAKPVIGYFSSKKSPLEKEIKKTSEELRNLSRRKGL
ncbi:hypothetical protein HYX19_04255 [Candidatus Woesearchaeota archaeon]|nr:hypothetical protein [Candidatus Woesearchaeota archaeon]